MLSLVVLTMSAVGLFVGEDEPCAPLEEPCDIRERECQARVLERVACFDEAGTSPTLPAIEVMERGALDEARDARFSGSDDEAPSLRDRGLAVLGLLEPRESAHEGLRRAMSDSMAHYDWPSQTLRVWPGENPRSARGVSLLAHELFHAVQRERWGRPLTAGARTTDAYFTALARMEGEATWVQWNIERELRGEGVPDPSERAEFLRRLLEDADEAVHAGGFTLPYAMRHHTYALGARLFGRASRRAAPLHAVELITEESVAGDAFSRPDGRLADVSGMEDELGAVALRALLGRARVSSVEAWRLAEEWRGDQFEVESVGEGEGVRISWSIRMSGARVATDIAALLEGTPGTEVSALEDVVMLLGMTAEDASTNP